MKNSQRFEDFIEMLKKISVLAKVQLEGNVQIVQNITENKQRALWYNNGDVVIARYKVGNDIIKIKLVIEGDNIVYADDGQIIKSNTGPIIRQMGLHKHSDQDLDAFLIYNEMEIDSESYFHIYAEKENGFNNERSVSIGEDLNISQHTLMSLLKHNYK